MSACLLLVGSGRSWLVSDVPRSAAPAPRWLARTSPHHVLRQTAAIRLPHAGNDITVIALWLGHAGAHVLECVHAEHALGGDDVKVFDHGAALDPGAVVMSMSVPPYFRLRACGSRCAAHEGLDAAVVIAG